MGVDLFLSGVAECLLRTSYFEQSTRWWGRELQLLVFKDSRWKAVVEHRSRIGAGDGDGSA